MRAIPESITEYETRFESEPRPISEITFDNVRAMFESDPEYRINKYPVSDGSVYAVFYIGQSSNRLSSYVWHVPAVFE